MEKFGPPQKSRWIVLLVLSLSLGILLLLAQFVLKKFKIDKQSAMNFEKRPVETRIETTQPVTRTYSQKDIEEARKRGQKLPGVYTPPTLPNAAGDAAVQQSLRTLEEINRINEMNRRLNEQQQRQQQQQR
jgi:hypothetical protein